MSNKRTVEIRQNGKWQTVKFEDLKKSDVFRLFEPDGTPVLWEEKSIFLCTSDASLDSAANVYGVEVEGLLDSDIDKDILK